MTKEEFIKKLQSKGFLFEIDRDKVIITRGEFDFISEITLFFDGDDLPPNVEFRNEGDVSLLITKRLRKGVEFNNDGDVYLPRIFNGWFSVWKGNIRGIKRNKLLNLMIKQGVLE
jgi:phage pi2 protein 07